MNDEKDFTQAPAGGGNSSGMNIAGGIATGLTNLAFGIIGSQINQNIQQEANEQLAHLNYGFNEQAAKNADARTRALYNDLTSPQALMQQYKKAGLSPSVMAGGSGIGGQTTQGAQGGIAGGSATAYGISPIDTAQINLMNAQARKLNVDADTAEGNNERGAEEIKQLVQDTGIKSLIKHYKATENLMQEISLALMTDKGTLEIDKLKFETQILEKQLYIATIDGEIKEETKKSVIKFINRQIEEQAERIFLMRAERNEKWSQTGLNQAMTKKLYNDVVVDWAKVGIEKSKVALGHEELEARIAQWAIENDFKTQENAREWAKLVVGIIQDDKKNMIDLIDAIIPLD